MTAREVRCNLTDEVNYVQDDGTTQYGCEHCRRNAPGAPRPFAEDPQVGPTITAAFTGGHCGECGDELEEGDLICPINEVWSHAECAP
jgi:hypothetical protein